MSRISTMEMLQLRELLQMETNSVAKAKATMNLIEDDELQRAGWIDVFYIVGSRKHVIATFCTIGRREHVYLDTILV